MSSCFLFAGLVKNAAVLQSGEGSEKSFRPKTNEGIGIKKMKIKHAVCATVANRGEGTRIAEAMLQNRMRTVNVKAVRLREVVVQ